eukprot:comp12797_c0_seq1/m.7940 comp12797_c0_seq1/g.7940  ORF comp12797_c0_seq1/g.7940 comp12797_c0_seq1/m.7940 type:complete len:245 (-) comp12797_c0_seq1:104-838(-)
MMLAGNTPKVPTSSTLVVPSSLTLLSSLPSMSSHPLLSQTGGTMLETLRLDTVNYPLFMDFLSAEYCEEYVLALIAIADFQDRLKENEATVDDGLELYERYFGPNSPYDVAIDYRTALTLDDYMLLRPGADGTLRNRDGLQKSELSRHFMGLLFSTAQTRLCTLIDECMLRFQGESGDVRRFTAPPQPAHTLKEEGLSISTHQKKSSAARIQRVISFPSLHSNIVHLGRVTSCEQKYQNPVCTE